MVFAGSASRLVLQLGSIIRIISCLVFQRTLRNHMNISKGNGQQKDGEMSRGQVISLSSTPSLPS